MLPDQVSNPGPLTYESGALPIALRGPAKAFKLFLLLNLGWSGGAMVLGKLPVPGRPTIWITVGQGPTALAVGGGGLDIFTLIYLFSPLSPSLWETARYRLKYCLKGPFNPKQPTNQSSLTSPSGDPLPKLLKTVRSVKQDGRQS